MADVNRILAAFRADLIAAELVRRPSEGPAGRPPMHVEPIEGPPAPGEREGGEDHATLVLSLIHAGDLTPADNFDARLGRVAILDVRYRAKTSAALRDAAALDAAIVARMLAPERNYGYGFVLADGTDAALAVQSVGVFGGFSPVSRSKSTGYDHVAKYAVAAAL